MATTAQKSTKQLLADLFNGLRNLVREHIHEVSVERETERRALHRAPITIGIAVGVTLVGVFLAGHAIALGLSALGVVPWLAHAIISAIALVIGVILLRWMPSRADLDQVPESAIRRIGHDIKELATEVAHDIKREPTHEVPRDVVLVIPPDPLPPGARR